MRISDSLREQMVRRLTTRRAQDPADEAIDLWERLARQLVAIVGDSGFESLYLRSLSLSSAAFPWLAGSSTVAPDSASRFDNLRASLEAQSAAQAREASKLLMLTFTDLLASLIGEPLTARILDSAWGPDTQATDKEGHRT